MALSIQELATQLESLKAESNNLAESITAACSALQENAYIIQALGQGSTSGPMAAELTISTTTTLNECCESLSQLTNNIDSFIATIQAA